MIAVHPQPGTGPYGVQERGNEERFAWEANIEKEVALANQQLRGVLEKTLDYRMVRLDKLTISESSIELEYVDDNIKQNMLQQTQFMALTAIADWFKVNAKIRPDVTIRSTARFGEGSLVSVTPADCLNGLGLESLIYVHNEHSKVCQCSSPCPERGESPVPGRINE